MVALSVVDCAFSWVIGFSSRASTVEIWLEIWADPRLLTEVLMAAFVPSVKWGWRG